jgi:tetratricopeptide (TPR) repeat protein
VFRDCGGGNPIETIPGIGYRLNRTVKPVVLTPARQEPSWRHLAAAALAIAVISAGSLVAATSIGHQHQAVRTWSAQSQRLYVVGRYYWNLRSREAVQKSLDYFTRVIDLSPTDARGYAALADANVTMGDYCYGTHAPSLYFLRAKQYASQALALDSNSSEADASLGFIELHQGRMRNAVAYLQRSLALDSSYAPAHEWYGIALLRSSHFSEGIAQLTVASRLDPLSVSTLAWLGATAYMQHRYDEAIIYSRMALEISPKRTDALAMLGRAYAARGDAKNAADAFRRYTLADPYHRTPRAHPTWASLEDAALFDA